MKWILKICVTFAVKYTCMCTMYKQCIVLGHVQYGKINGQARAFVRGRGPGPTDRKKF